MSSPDCVTDDCVPLVGVSLESTNLIRKYIGVFDIFVTLLLQFLNPMKSQHAVDTTGNDVGKVWIVVNTHPWRVYSAMAAHYTQFVWYRRMFIFFSRFSFVNSFKIFFKAP